MSQGWSQGLHTPGELACLPSLSALLRPLGSTRPGSASGQKHQHPWP